MSTPARRRLMRDFKRLQTDPPAGISGAPQENDILKWHAVIFGYVEIYRNTYYYVIMMMNDDDDANLHSLLRVDPRTPHGKEVSNLNVIICLPLISSLISSIFIIILLLLHFIIIIIIN